ncbi:MAG: hypothetical protein C4K47_10115 [Candidatus Thorarchaeota archaeon]|nr:MAG: hypothetical protein C4K47_10115 [Candidatus Thorarchaeota archaeon]
MDFTLSLYVAVVISSLEVFLAAGVYTLRLRSTYRKVSSQTVRALLIFLIASLVMGVLEIQSVIETFLAPIWIAVLFGLLLIAQMSLIVSSDRRFWTLSAVIFLGIAVVAVNTVYTFLTSGVIEQPLTVAVLASFLVCAVTAGLYLMKVSPSAFTVSIMALILLALIAAVSVAIQVPTLLPQYFVLVAAPAVLTAAILGSFLRPWRRIITLSIVLLALTVGISLALPAYIGGDVDIWAFATVAAFAGGCTVLPMEFFIDQAQSTRAKTPTYISYTLVFVALLAITHSNNFAIAYSGIIGYDVWDPSILYIDWIFGVSGVCAFLMAAVSANVSEQIRNASRDIAFGFCTILLTLGHPFVENGRYVLDPLYVPVMILILLGFLGLSRVAIQLYRTGSGKAGARFESFMFASLAIGIVAMFANRIPLLLLVPLMIGAGLLLIASSPRGFVVFGKAQSNHIDGRTRK